MTDVAFTCSCGSVKGTIADATPSGGNHIACFCDSCRAAVIYCGADDPTPGPVELFQSTADHIKVTQGQNNLVPFSFGPKNLLRWQAKCCGVQLFSTPRNPSIPLVGVITERLETTSSIGPVNSRAFVPKANGKAGHEKIGGFFKMVARSVGKRFTGGWRETPFFNVETKQPVSDVILISREEKHKLLNRI